MKIRNIKVLPGDRWFIPGDIHFDQQDDKALRVATSMMKDQAVNGVCLIGDTFNSMGISRHASLKTLRNYRPGGGTIKDEYAAASPWLTEWRQMVMERRGFQADHNKEITNGLVILEGNHERWWSCVQDEFPGLLDTQWPELYGDLFDGWHVYDGNYGLKFGRLLVVHGHNVRGSLSKRSAFKVWQEYPAQNTLYGHTHRQEQWIGATMKDGVQELHGAWTIGHMRNRDSELEDSYMGQHAERHQQGGALIDFYEASQGSGLGFCVTLCPVLRDHEDKPYMVVGGRIYHYDD